MSEPCPDKKRPEEPKLEEPPLEEYQRPPCQTSPNPTPKATTTAGKKKPKIAPQQPGKKIPKQQSNDSEEKSPCPSPLLFK